MRGSSRLALSILSALSLGLRCVGDFDLGVGAFEAEPDRAILWTHVVPVDPTTESVTVHLVVATDPGFGRIVRKQAASAKASEDFTVRVLVPGLKPSTRYYYRFSALADSSGSI